MLHTGGELHDFFEETLKAALGRRAEVVGYRFLAGGSINNTVLLSTSEGSFVLKWNENAPETLLETEAKGLHILADAKALRVPKVLCLGTTQNRPWLLMEYIETGHARPEYWQKLGQGLALLHGHRHTEYGLDFDNFLGSIPQQNTWTDSLETFFGQQRILAQAGMALYEEKIDSGTFHRLEAVSRRLPELLPAGRPALVHGDLWNGNILVDPYDEPVVIDPAVHYGLREADLAMSRLFGGFEDGFYQAYQEAFPLEPGFENRVDIYNLYPLLAHVNLFGDGYLPPILRTLDRLLF
jgi:protein-ribulosamine 3-kinase